MAIVVLVSPFSTRFNESWQSGPPGYDQPATRTRCTECCCDFEESEAITLWFCRKHWLLTYRGPRPLGRLERPAKSALLLS
ncbi:hypothetical protein RGR602_PC00965 (plasmid) [Rhizobium gallicum bv. gallicum R602sp]|uniref:Uncharacterized protein n=1 Tax=Rhizobium gallicum bv. gallicum R602sp TaxID=1041138 RepID=A0A0B4XD17_9HYPH|nr:hypothetical protein RGR602_PC00965 [Rhizobium gallicum bv. gallicum R602sp]